MMGARSEEMERALLALEVAGVVSRPPFRRQVPSRGAETLGMEEGVLVTVDAAAAEGLNQRDNARENGLTSRHSSRRRHNDGCMPRRDSSVTILRVAI